MPKKIVAVVSDVRGEGKKRYAIAYPREPTPEIPEGQSVTFSIDLAWQEDREPQQGQVVLLGDMTLFEKGWRALRAYSFTQQ